jgi:hypothetical protein
VAGEVFNERVFTLNVQRIAAKQTHPVPKHGMAPQGPFPPEMQGYDEATNRFAHILAEPKLVYDYQAAESDDGSDFELGTTAQNNYRPIRWLRCGTCLERVREDETQFHVCEE